MHVQIHFLYIIFVVAVISCILYLGHDVELHHGIGKWVSIRFQARNKAKHGPVESAIYLFQGNLSWVVHIHDRHMTKEPKQGEKKFFLDPCITAEITNLNN